LSKICGIFEKSVKYYRGGFVILLIFGGLGKKFAIKQGGRKMNRRKLVIVASAVVVIFLGLVGTAAVSQNLLPEEQQGLSLVKQALSPAQMRVILDFIRSHMGEAREAFAKEKAQHGKDLAFEKALNITPAQEDQLVGIASARIDKIKPLADSLYGAGVALERALLADHPEPTVIRSASLTMGQEIGNAALVGSGMVKEARQVLTADQVGLIEGRIKEADSQGKAELDKMPARADEIISLVKALDVTPDQVTGAIKLAKAAEPFFEQQGKIHHARMEMELRQALSADQIKLLKNYETAQEKLFEPKAREYEALGIKTWNDFKLTKPQLDALVAVTEINKPAIMIVVRAIADSGIELRNAVIAADDAGVNSAASGLGENIAQAALLGSDLIKCARGILTASQVQMILNLVSYIEKESYNWIQILPDQAEKALKLRADLNITPAQREALKAMGEKHYQKEMRRAEILLQMDPGDLLK
jgi:hypothetical protein